MVRTGFNLITVLIIFSTYRVTDELFWTGEGRRRGGGGTGEVHRYKFPGTLREEAYTADLNRISESSYSCGRRKQQIAHLALEKIYTMCISDSPVSANLDYDKNYLIKSEGGCQAVCWSLLDFTLIH